MSRKAFRVADVSNNDAETKPDDTADTALLSNADHTNLQTIPGIGPGTAAQLVVAVNIPNFDNNDKLANNCGLVLAA